MPSKRELIRKNIITSLQEITTANGYNHTVKLVDDKRESIEKLRQDQFPCIFVTYGEPETVEIITHDGGYLDATLNFVLFCYLKVERGKSEADEADKLIADIKRALYVDIFRGGNAHNTLIKSIDVDLVNEIPYVSIDIMVRVNYIHPRNSP